MSRKIPQVGYLLWEAGMKKIPNNYLDLVNCPRVAALTTVMPDGRPQTTVVWCDFDGEFVRVNAMRGFRKEKNMHANPKVTLLCFDPYEPLRFLEIRGLVIEMTEKGAMEHLDGWRKAIQVLSYILGSVSLQSLKKRRFPSMQDPSLPCCNVGR